MLDWDLWLAYLGTVLLIVCSPGPSVLLVSSHRILYGRRAVAPTVAGDLSANLLQMAAASVGLAVVVQSSGHLFAAVKWLGAAYLVGMGIIRLTKGRRPDQKPSAMVRREAPPAALFRRGFLVSAANPKAIVFFAGLFPLFLDPSRPLLPQLSVLAVTFLLCDGSALALYSRAGGLIKDWLSRRGKQHWEDRITASLLIGAGLGLAAKRL